MQNAMVKSAIRERRDDRAHPVATGHILVGTSSRQRVALPQHRRPEGQTLHGDAGDLDGEHPGLAYVRCHNRTAEGYIRSRSVPERFDYDYSMKELREIAGRVQRLAEHARAVHVLYIPTAFFAFAMSLATMTTRVRVARYKAVMFTPALASFLASAPSEPGLSSMLITSTSCSPAT